MYTLDYSTNQTMFSEFGKKTSYSSIQSKLVTTFLPLNIMNNGEEIIVKTEHGKGFRIYPISSRMEHGKLVYQTKSSIYIYLV